MDIVLEITDYFLFDKLYATALPKSVGKAIPNDISKLLRLGDYSQYSALYTNSTSALIESLSSLNQNFSLSSLLTPQYGMKQQLIDNLSSLNGHQEMYGLFPKYFPITEATYGSVLLRSNIIRQVISLFFIMSIFGWLLYFVVAYVSFLTVFDKEIFNHPRYLKNQVSLEIAQASSAIPVMVLLTIPWFLAELRGYSKLYMEVDESTGGWKAIFWQIPSFIMFTDCGIYFIHRWLHWPWVYKMLHKPHHKWIVCTPFASHAFHPVDGYAQSLPYHIFPFLFPLHKVLYLLLFTFVNFWTVMIHDGQYLSNDPFINGTACHTIHHLYFNYNYGQFTTLWDRLGGSYRHPPNEFFDKKAKVDKKVWAEQTKQMEVIRNELEGKDDNRVYIDEDEKKDI